MEPISNKSKNSIGISVLMLLLVLLAFGMVGCAGYTPGGIKLVPVSNREVVELNPDDVVIIMRRAGFSDRQILQFGAELRNGLAQSGAVQIMVGDKLEVIFAVKGDAVYISTRLRGNFIYNVNTGWVGG